MSDSTNYLNDLPEWSADIAYKLGHEDGFELTPEHIEILDIARIFYASTASLRQCAHYAKW